MRLPYKLDGQLFRLTIHGIGRETSLTAMSTPEEEEPPGREDFVASLAKFGEERGYVLL